MKVKAGVAAAFAAAVVAGFGGPAGADTHTPADAGFVQLRNGETGKCLVVQGLETLKPAFQFTCVSAYWDQWWRVEVVYRKDERVWYRLRNYKSNLCLSSQKPGGSYGSTRAFSYPCGRAGHFVTRYGAVHGSAATRTTTSSRTKTRVSFSGHPQGTTTTVHPSAGSATQVIWNARTDGGRSRPRNS